MLSLHCLCPIHRASAIAHRTPLPLPDLPSAGYAIVPGVRYLTFKGAPYLYPLNGNPTIRLDSTLDTCAKACNSLGAICKAFQLILVTLQEDDSVKQGNCYFYTEFIDPEAPGSDSAFADPRTIIGQRRTSESFSRPH